MKLPFTDQQFFELFRRYNEGVFPAQIVAILLCLGLIALAFRGASGRLVYGALAALWAWNGAMYHMAYFSEINPVARVFGVAFLLQAVVFLVAALRGDERFRFRGGAWPVLGAAVVLYGVVLYPLLGWMAGHAYPSSPVLGVAPCPTSIFTFGVLMLCEMRLRWWVGVLPLLWAVVGTSAAFTLGVIEDYGLGASGLLFLAYVFAGRKHAPPQFQRPEGPREDSPGQRMSECSATPAGVGMQSAVY